MKKNQQNRRPLQRLFAPVTLGLLVSTSLIAYPPAQQPDPPFILPTGYPLCQNSCSTSNRNSDILSDDLIKRTIGYAEGTLDRNGQPTWAYKRHLDPGNKRWNIGLFSYQHPAASPEDADNKQLARLRQQQEQLQEQAKQRGLILSKEEWLNALDLANQSPGAALLPGGYLDRLSETRTRFMDQQEAIIWARTWAYWDPDLNRWDAPGLGNREELIWADQKRRQEAIATVLAIYE